MPFLLLNYLDFFSIYIFIYPLGRTLHEVTLNESIRYRNGDQVEDWLNTLLCLDVAVPAPKLISCPSVEECKLYPFKN